MRKSLLEKEPSLLVVDLFCGAGGTSTGFAKSRIAKVIACVNHDAKAINSHWANHPDVEHFTEDMRVLDLTRLIEIVKFWKAIYPNAKLVLWASLECTNFSKAKGGMARDADSRTLADHLHRYITALNPDFIQIENVVEFREWGPCRIKAKKTHLDAEYPYTDLCIIKQKLYTDVAIVLKSGKIKIRKKMTKVPTYGWVPVKELKGTDFKRWCSDINAHGYRNEWKEMNSANFGAYTSRNRLFGMFAKAGLPIGWPEATHAKNAKGGLFPWNAVKEKINFSNQGYSIFDRGTNMAIPLSQRKDLVDATFERVYAGLIKFVAGGKKNFMVKYNSMDSSGSYAPPDMDTACPVISTQNRLYMGSVEDVNFISKYFSGNPYGKNISVHGPAGTIRCIDGQAVVNTSFVSVYHGNGHNCHSTDTAAPVIPTKDGLTIVNTIPFIDMQYGVSCATSVAEPLGSITNIPKANLAQAVPFIVNTHYNNTATGIEEPLRVITSDRHYAYLLNPSWGGNPHSVDEACPVIVARQDKAPLYLVATEEGYLAIEIFEHDTPIVRKIKEFMAMYGIVDIKMRMLDVQELKEIQGFPKDYRLDGSKADQKKFIGNSVVPEVVEHWALAMHYELTGEYLKAA